MRRIRVRLLNEAEDFLNSLPEKENREERGYITWEEYLDGQYGPIGTPKRDEFEARVAAEVVRDNERIARKEARKAKLQSLVSPIVNAINSVSEGQAQVART